MDQKKTLKKGIMINFINSELAYCVNLNKPQDLVMKVEGVSCLFLKGLRDKLSPNDVFDQIVTNYAVTKDCLLSDFNTFCAILEDKGYLEA